MASGGRRSRSGPPPDPMSRTSLINGREFIVLPAKHRHRAPKFPLPVIKQYDEYYEDKQRVRDFDQDATDDLRDAELEMWARLWKKPQAVMWARLGLADQVAAYVRAFLESTSEKSNAGLKTAAIRMETELGISTSGLLQNGWVIEVPAASSSADTRPARGGETTRRTPTGSWLEAVKVEQSA